MAIYTKFGTKVRLFSKDGAWITVITEDGRKREWLETQFKADGGWDELEKALSGIPEVHQATRA